MGNVALAILGTLHRPLGRVVASHVGIGGNNPHPLTSLSDQIGDHTYYCLGKGVCHITGSVGIGGEINLDTVIETLVVMAIIILLALAVRARLSVTRPGAVQNVLEAIFDFVNGFVVDNLGSARAASIGPLALALFLFILLSNYLDLLPIPGVKSPTSDINTTLALAGMVFVLVQTLGLRARGGGGYVRHFFQPFSYLFPINLIEEIARPVTLCFRLFGNIFAGEVLILVFAALLAGFLPALPFAHAFAVGLGIFVGAIQAFIFSVLTVAYIGIATSTEGH
jgi:F-type H+-transporting ATPase subunit a